MAEGEQNPGSFPAPRAPAIVIGYGLPGRTVVQGLEARGAPCHIIELNPQTVARCRQAGIHLIEGDAREPGVLRQAGIDSAGLVVVAVPDEHVAVQIIEAVRRLNSSVSIVARCTFTSGGLQAMKAGANEVVVAEQAVAELLQKAAGQALLNGSGNGSAGPHPA